MSLLSSAISEFEGVETDKDASLSSAINKFDTKQSSSLSTAINKFETTIDMPETFGDETKYSNAFKFVEDMDKQISSGKVDLTSEVRKTLNEDKTLPDTPEKESYIQTLANDAVTAIKETPQNIVAGYQNIISGVGKFIYASLDRGADPKIAFKPLKYTNPFTYYHLMKSDKFKDLYGKLYSKTYAKLADIAKGGAEYWEEEAQKMTPKEVKTFKDQPFSKVSGIVQRTLPLSALAIGLSAVTKSPAGLALFGGTVYGESYVEVKKNLSEGKKGIITDVLKKYKGMSDREVADTVGMLKGAFTVATEKFALDEILGAKGLFSLADFLKGGKIEALQEVVENWGHNLIDKFGSDKARKISEGTMESAIGGFFTAGALSVVTGKSNQQTKQELTEEFKENGADDNIAEQTAEEVVNGLEEAQKTVTQNAVKNEFSEEESTNLTKVMEEVESQKEIPEFKSTEEAEEFGQKDQPKTKLKEQQKVLLDKVNQLKSEGKMDEALQLATGQGQFVNEALAEAQQETVQGAKTPTTPVQSEGKLKTPKLIQRLETKLRSIDEAKNITYNRLDIKKDAQKAIAFVQNNPKEVKKIIFGNAEQPEGITGSALREAYRMSVENDPKEYAKISQAEAFREVRLGQEISTLQEWRKDTDPINYVKTVIGQRLQKIAKNDVNFGSKKAKKGTQQAGQLMMQQEKANLKNKLSFRQLKIQNAQSILDSITC